MILITGFGSQYTLHEGDNVIGRGNDCDLRLISDQVSRRHAVVRWDGRRATVIDLGSTNGTRLNGQPLEPNRPYPLDLGDRLELGGAEGRLEMALASVPAAPIVLTPAPPAVERSRPAVPVWLAVAGAAAVVLLILAGGLLWSAARKPTVSAVTPPQQAAAATSKAVVIPPPTVPVALPTLTIVSLPTVKPITEAGAGVSGAGGAAGASGAGVAAVPKQLPLEQLAAGQIPPINPTSMPELITSLVQGVSGGAGAPPAVGTLVSKLPGGLPLPGQPGSGTPSPLTAGSRRYGAPALRAPADGASFKGENATVVLEWEPVQNLQAKDYYRVIVFYKKDGKELAGGTWMKGTSYRVPVWFLAQQSGRFEWQVVIVEATELPENGGKLGATVSDPSARRWFSWTVDEGQPAGPPGDTPTPPFEG